MNGAQRDMPFRSYPRRKKTARSPGLFATEPQKTAPDTCLVAHVDGGARGNPGPAGFGVVIEDQSRARVAEISRYLGHQTNNYAEYMGLLAALRYALDNQCKALEVVSDSELLVRQINGEYKVRSPHLLDLYHQAKSLIRQLEFFRIRHVRREHNSAADALANRAVDEGSHRTHSREP